MLLTRVITAAVLLAVLTLSIYIGPFAFASVMAIAFGATLYEWLRIGGLGPRPALLVAAVEMVVQLSLYWAGALPKMDWFLFIVDGVVMIAWFAGYASMWAAVFADSGVAALCVLNSVRMLYKK